MKDKLLTAQKIAFTKDAENVTLKAELEHVKNELDEKVNEIQHLKTKLERPKSQDSETVENLPEYVVGGDDDKNKPSQDPSDMADKSVSDDNKIFKHIKIINIDPKDNNEVRNNENIDSSSISQNNVSDTPFQTESVMDIIVNRSHPPQLCHLRIRLFPQILCRIQFCL